MTANADLSGLAQAFTASLQGIQWIMLACLLVIADWEVNPAWHLRAELILSLFCGVHYKTVDKHDWSCDY
jgi:hypothetical protein